MHFLITSRLGVEKYMVGQEVMNLIIWLIEGVERGRGEEKGLRGGSGGVGWGGEFFRRRDL